MQTTTANSEPGQLIFSVQTIYQTDGPDYDAYRYTYEERIVIFRAVSFEDAVAQAESEADEYGKRLTVKPLDYCMAYKLDDDEDLPAGIEVFSLMRDSNLDANDYLDRHYDTGSERARSCDD